MAQMSNPSRNGSDGTGSWGVGTSVTDPFTTNGIFLVGKGQVHRSGGGEQRQVDGGGRVGGGTNVESHILEAKGGSASISRGRVGVFAGATEKE